MKIITICGSLKFKKTMMEEAERLELLGNCVLTPIYPTKENYTKEEIKKFNELHFAKIKLSNAIYVVNVEGYIGKQTQKEIIFAKENKKEIIYFDNSKNTL